MFSVDVLFSLTCLFFLVWVLLLKIELARQKEENRQLREKLERFCGSLKEEVSVIRGRRAWGRPRPSPPKAP